jgi:diguanylate cyclase (GGDEF)-like protein/PAS domain S-box-containing protein
LRAQLDHVRAILDAVAAGYAVTQGPRLVEVNAELCRILGFSADELVGAETPWPFWPPESHELAYRLVAEVPAKIKETGEPYTFELPLIRKDGSRFTAEVTCAPAIAPSGSLVGWVSTIRDISPHRDHEAELQRLADHDPLTGLANRRVFEQRLGQELADAVRHGREMAVAILDLDRFKQVNDRFGHLAGDRALKETAARLRSVQRKGDVLARVGGEEFAWILAEAHADGAWEAVERARRTISEEPFAEIGELTISIGVSLRGELHDAARIYELADQALYRAKREGRNRSVLSGTL